MNSADSRTGQCLKRHLSLKTLHICVKLAPDIWETANSSAVVPFWYWPGTGGKDRTKMRAVYEQAGLDRIDEELHTGHAEITVRLDSGDLVYVQAHDNGIGRYFALSRVSYFDADQTEEEDDILEEYTTGQEESAAAGDQDFIDFLGDWNEKMEKMDEAPYIHSMFSSYFEMGERMLDLMLAEMEEDQPLG